MWYRIWYRIKKKSRKNSPSTIELISLDIYIFHHSTSLCCESKVIICKIIQLIPQLILCRPIELILFYFSQNESLVFYPNLRLSFSKIIQCSADCPLVLAPSRSPFIDRYSFRHNSLSRNPDYGRLRLFQFDQFTWWPQDRLKSRIFLVYHDLHSNFLESRNLFAFQVRTPHFRSILFIH